MQVWMEPLVQRCCWDLKPFMSTGKLGGGDEIGEEDEAPALELRTVAEIEVFGEGIVLPAAGVFDAGAAPEAGGAVEIEEAAAAAAGGLLEEQVAIEEHGLHPREQRIGAVQVAPAGLDHADLGIGEIVDGAAGACPARGRNRHPG